MAAATSLTDRSSGSIRDQGFYHGVSNLLLQFALNIKILSQIDDGKNYKCGAYALHAVLSYFGHQVEVDDIWNSISSPRPRTMQQFAYVYSLAQYSIKKGVQATIYKSKNILQTLDKLDDMKQTAILVVAHKKPGDVIGHFIVYKGKKDGDYIFADSEFTKDRRISPIKMRDFCRATGPEVCGNILIVFGKAEKYRKCDYCETEYPMVDYETLANTLAGAICCNCNQGVLITP